MAKSRTRLNNWTELNGNYPLLYLYKTLSLHIWYWKFWTCFSIRLYLLFSGQWQISTYNYMQHTYQNAWSLTSVVFNSLCPYVLCLPGFSAHGITRVDCHALLQGIFPTQGSNLCLMSPALAGGFFTTSTTWETPEGIIMTDSHWCTAETATTL